MEAQDARAAAGATAMEIISIMNSNSRMLSDIRPVRRNVNQHNRDRTG